MSLSNVTANAVLLHVCPIVVPQEDIVIKINMRSSHVLLTYPVVISTVIIASVASNTS